MGFCVNKKCGIYRDAIKCEEARQGRPSEHDAVVQWMIATYFELTWLATLQDVSYQCCIEVAGSRCDVLSCLTPFFSGDTGK